MYSETKDKYEQGPRKKTFGYPKGEKSLLLDDILLRNVEIIHVVGMLVILPFATTNFVIGLPVVPRYRARYLDWAMFDGDSNVRDDIKAIMQIWANNQRIASMLLGEIRGEFGVYIPPESNITFYAQGGWLFANNRYIRYKLKFIEFDELSHPWEFGSGGYRPNPAAWPV